MASSCNHPGFLTGTLNEGHVQGKVWNPIVLNITGFNDYFYKNNRFCRFMVFKITGFSENLP